LDLLHLAVVVDQITGLMVDLALQKAVVLVQVAGEMVATTMAATVYLDKVTQADSAAQILPVAVAVELKAQGKVLFPTPV
jgi:hypothetical protein